MSRKYFDLTSEEYTADYNEVKNIGEVNSPLTDGRAKALIARILVRSLRRRDGIASPGLSPLRRVSSLWENARLFGLVNFALADAYIAHSDSKYLYEFWRPITAIERGIRTGTTTRWQIQLGPRFW